MNTPGITLKSHRIESIDILRGLVMIIMILDHTRKFMYSANAMPTDLSEASIPLFFTRWITHFCAPVFVFLSGTGAFLYGTKSSPEQLTRFLWTRGLWLVIADLTIIVYAWTFDITFSKLVLGVVWAIGISMICLSVLIKLPQRLVLIFCLAMVLFHNALDLINLNGTSLTDALWYLLHQKAPFPVSPHLTILFEYPLIPWIGFMALGYLFGNFYRKDFDPAVRRKWLWRLGISCIVLFIAFRGLRVYLRGFDEGVPHDFVYAILSMINTKKYPPSVFFLLMTMGPSFIFLALIETVKNRFTDILVVFGRVPFFFYVLHLYIVHGLSLLLFPHAVQTLGEEASRTIDSAGGGLNGLDTSLPFTWLLWILITFAMYPLCKWYGGYKARHRDKWWLSYV